jgi:peptidoglycan/xylan/chitin deacetylase (PgdA/CDA1 family)/glycosyltransferase involved in cell wall biosynthesis
MLYRNQAMLDAAQASLEEGQPTARPSLQPLPSFSIVIPTYQRRDTVVSSVQALGEVSFDGLFDIIVVVDGSTDGTADALRALRLPVALQVLEQENAGAAAARNAGALRATGDVVLFLDDDMVADRDLLLKHAQSHLQGADAVLGHIPLHPDSIASRAGASVGKWAEERRARLVAPGSKLQIGDLLSGQISVRRDLFLRLGGFDQTFTRDGGFGNEDLDFGCRLLSGGSKVVFNPDAISWQRYVVTPEKYLAQWRMAGRADVLFARKHPSRASSAFAGHGIDKPLARLVLRPLSAVAPVSWLAQRLSTSAALTAMKHRPQSRVAYRMLVTARDLGYWGNVAANGGVPRARPVLVLAYHAIADLKGDKLLESYCVPPEEFRSQLDLLLRQGFNFISAAEFLSYLCGEHGLPSKPVLLTFDDCYADLLTVAGPILRERGIPALAFAVSSLLGKSNVWDQRKGGSVLRLLDAEELKALAEHGITIGAHTASHPDLTRLADEDLRAELAGAAEALARHGLPRPQFVAYPYGRHNAEVRQEAERSGYSLAFSLDGGRASRKSDRFAVPRTEIRRGQAGWRLLWRAIRAPGGR